MDNYKKPLLTKIGYTELVYARINKKLKTDLSRSAIRKIVLEIIKETDEAAFMKKGKIYTLSITPKTLSSPLTLIQTE